MGARVAGAGRGGILQAPSPSWSEDLLGTSQTTAWEDAAHTAAVNSAYVSYLQASAPAVSTQGLSSPNAASELPHAGGSKVGVGQSDVGGSATQCVFCATGDWCQAEVGKTRSRRKSKKTCKPIRSCKWLTKRGYRGEPTSGQCPHLLQCVFVLAEHILPAAGPAYCERCSDIFRSHVIREKTNSANCTRATLCRDCAKVMAHFVCQGEELWESFRVGRSLKTTTLGLPVRRGGNNSNAGATLCN